MVGTKQNHRVVELDKNEISFDKSTLKIHTVYIVIVTISPLHPTKPLIISSLGHDHNQIPAVGTKDHDPKLSMCRELEHIYWIGYIYIYRERERERERERD